MSNNDDNIFSLDTILKEIDNTDKSNIDNTIDETKTTKKKNNKKTTINMNNYKEIPKEEWNSIPLGTYIRYKENNIIQQGGKITNIVNNTSITINKYNYFRRKYNTKTIMFNDITNIYRYIKNEQQITDQKTTDTNLSDPATPMSQLGDKLLFNNNESLKDEIDNLKREIDTLKAHITRIDDNTVSLIKMIKKIYKPST